jgi:hypothetical protein
MADQIEHREMQVLVDRSDWNVHSLKCVRVRCYDENWYRLSHGRLYRLEETDEDSETLEFERRGRGIAEKDFWRECCEGLEKLLEAADGD